MNFFGCVFKGVVHPKMRIYHYLPYLFPIMKMFVIIKKKKNKSVII